MWLLLGGQGGRLPMITTFVVASNSCKASILASVVTVFTTLPALAQTFRFEQRDPRARSFPAAQCLNPISKEPLRKFDSLIGEVTGAEANSAALAERIRPTRHVSIPG